MKCTVFAALFAALFACAAWADDDQKLFNGKDLQDWEAEGAKDFKDKDGKVVQVWSVRDGMLHCEGKGFGFLRYGKREYADFEFHFEYRMTSPQCNSGIGIRTRAFDPKLSRETRPSLYSYEIQLFDDHGKAPDVHSTGSLYRYVAPRVNPSKPRGEWNSADIVCVGPHIRVTINDEKVIDVDQTTLTEIKNKPLKGYVCLQNHGGILDFRNLRIREIKSSAGH
ncbi:MAG TPA: DUF1080 domain-containing protein [Gemmataceae bacterium]|jgi:hypothetical protein|nr:DUF1080 domain-containing protein [Gemmataceae bacterium]